MVAVVSESRPSFAPERRSDVPAKCNEWGKGKIVARSQKKYTKDQSCTCCDLASLAVTVSALLTHRQRGGERKSARAWGWWGSGVQHGADLA